VSASRPPSQPPQIPGFDYLQMLGSGGFADVFLYEQRMPRRRVAIKVLLKETLSDGARESFDAEANLMAQLSTHPSIVTIYQAGISDDGRPYLAMEYCPKPNLGARYRREKISVAEALRVGVQVAGAVETSHRAGILHRDIKPANILVTEYNRPALTDFGISVALVGGAEQESVGMSIPWSPPEVFGSTPSSGVAGDVYSLGATVYTLLAGRSPFEVPGGSNGGIDLIARIQASALPRIGRTDVPASLEEVLATAMAKREDARYASALEFARALQKVQLELSLAVTPADVLDDSLPSDDFEEEDEGNTRIRGIVSIDPTAPVVTGRAGGGRAQTAPPARPSTGSASATPAASTPVIAPAPTPVFSSPGRSRATDDDAPPTETTLRRPGAGSGAAGVDAAGAEGAAARPRRTRLPLIIGIAVAVVLVGGGIAVFAANAGGGSPAAAPTEPGVAPVEVIPEGAVQAVTDLAGTAQPQGIVFTWKNPAPHDGDRYQWAVVTPGADPQYQPTTDPTATVPGPASGQVCIQVVVVHPDGRASDPATGCAP
jgi:serine/threonine protein kinase